jgi:hypothetical protein
MSICQPGKLSNPCLCFLHFLSGFFLICFRHLDETIQAAIALEFLGPRNAISIPARFDACGGNARYLFSNLDLNTLKATILDQTSKFDVDRLSKTVDQQVKKV